MPALPLVLTTAGRDALINAQNTGASNVVITQIGLSPNHVALTAATAAIAGEFKRLNLVGGQVVAPETFYVSGTDTSADTYTVRTVALYLSNGVLLGAYSQAAVLLEKAEPAMAVIEASIRLAEPLATVIEFTGGGWNNPPSAEGVEGVIRLATQLEVNAGTNGTRAVTPLTLKTLMTAVLAGFSPTGHTHDAGAIVSGVFAEARVPDLGMARITGLVAALAGKAAAAHTHAQAEVVGLIDALAGKAAAAHTHVMGDVTGLVTALAGKAAAVHTHVMADITGLAAALTLKADLASPTFTGSAKVSGALETLPDVNGLLTLGRFSPGYPYALVRPDQNATGVEIRSFTGNPLVRINQATGELTVTGPITTAGSVVWNAGNFDPASKAAVNHTHTWTQIQDKPNLVVNEGSSVIKGETGGITVAAQAGPGAGVGGWARAHKFAGGSADVSAGRFGGYGGGDVVSFAFITAGADPDAFLGPNSLRVYPTYAAWGGNPLWHAGNFDPAGKADLAGAAFTGGVQAISIHLPTGADRTITLGSATNYSWQIRSSGDHFEIREAGDAAKVRMRMTYPNGDVTFQSSVIVAGGHLVWHAGNARSSAAAFRNNGDNLALTPNNVWAAAALVAAAQAATIPIDLATGFNFTTTMTGNRTLGAPANAKPGQSGVIQLIQDGTGNRTLAFDAAWKFEGGVEPVLSTAANARDVLVFTVIAPGDVVASLLKAVS